MRGARCSAAWRWWSSPAGSRSCSRASTPTRSRPASTCSRSASRWGWSPGITPFNFPAMVPMWMYPVAIACGNTFVLKPSERDPSASLFVAELWQRGRPAGRRVHRRERRQGGGRRAAGPPAGRRGVVRRVDADRAVHPPAGHRRTASGCRPWAGRRTTRSCCRTPTSTSPPTTWPRPRSGRPGSAAWRSRAAVAVGAGRRRAWWRRERAGARRSRSAPAGTRAARWARSSPRPRRNGSSA